MPWYDKSLKPGSIWIYKNSLKGGITSRDILAKVLRVTENKVFIMCKTRFGFEDLPPVSMDKYDFVNRYFLLEEVK